MANNININKLINFFSKLEKNEVVTQSNIAKTILISIGMANSLLKKAIKKGYVKVKSAPYKRYSYYLTKKGFAEKSRLVKSFLDSSLEFFNQTKKEYIEILKKNSNKKICVIGSGDLIDITKLASLDSGIKIRKIIEFNEKKKNFSISFDELSYLSKSSYFVLAESKNPQLLYNNLIKKINPKKILDPNFLHISKKNNN